MSTEFSYFDIFGDLNVNFSDYLSNLSTTDYKYSFSNKQQIDTFVKNLFSKIEIIDQFKKNVDIIFNYTINENESITQVSYNNYKSVDYWWIILVFNNITNPFKDWPLNQEQLLLLVDYYVKKDGKYSKDFYYNYLFQMNENKRNIILPKSYAISDIIWAYKDQV